MPQLAPVDEITAVENRQTWKIFKRGIHQVIVLAHPTDGGIRIKTWQNRVTKCSGHGLLLSVEHNGDTVADQYAVLAGNQAVLKVMAATESGESWTLAFSPLILTVCKGWIQMAFGFS